MNAISPEKTRVLSLVVAVARNGVIGRDGSLPWHISSDLRRFKQLTMGHEMIMGRRTAESLGRPLPGRRNIVVTRGERPLNRGFEMARSLDQALDLTPHGAEVFVIGGARLYAEALPRVVRIYLTLVLADVAGDTHFPQTFLDLFPKLFRGVSTAAATDDVPSSTSEDATQWIVTEDVPQPIGKRDEYPTHFFVFARAAS